ncbi:reactive intermediate/imine deaminase [Desulfuromonas versatilis]|uniref:Reactive intermediate/imine deaminase n=1 Tax=Desulfuromonas versatilis TaxID=2802975 RepID=A0ABM8HVP0_9BACT|nr:RidA family protein [Desulfuromonas versatilis]BCR05172.1 reactive intermediate/imine deaminase [Desulfuromonas versatilis]
MTIRKIETSQAPAAIGPYSQGIRAGEFCFFSGQIPLDPATGEVVAGGIEAQAERVMANMEAALAAAGLTFEQVVKTTIFLTDLKDFAAVNAIYGSRFKAIPPARSTVQVAALPKGVSIEIEWVAYAGK